MFNLSVKVVNGKIIEDRMFKWISDYRKLMRVYNDKYNARLG